MRLGRGFGLSEAKQGRWYVRVLRGLRPDRNPLRRRADRLQACLLIGLFVAAAAAAPFAAQAASNAAYTAALRQQQAQLTATHQVRAVLTQVAADTLNINTASPVVPVDATWTSVTGVKRTGLVMAPTGSPRGTAVTVYTDDAGNLTSPPLEPSQVTGQGELAAIGAVVSLGLLYLCALLVIRHVLNRRRLAAWEAAWVVTARAWNRQSW
jgi:hypothetical protein